MDKKKYYNCCVFGCLNSTLNCELTFFSLPIDVERRCLWLKLIKREDLNDKSSLHCRVCEDHFDEESILTSSKRKVLKKNTLPCKRLPNQRYESTGSQATPETAEAYTQCYEANPSSQTPLYLSRVSSDTPRKRKLKNEILESRKSLKATDSSESKEMLVKLCEKFLPKKLADIVKEKTKLQNCQGNRYGIDYTIFCLNLYYVSPQAYNLLKDTLSLPNKTALKRMHTPLTIKVNNRLMEALETKVKHMTEMERNCSFVVSVTSLKANLFYSNREDKMYGFHEIDGVQSSETAKYALVAMICGIFENYEQPVGYALLAECKSYDSASEWIDKLIQKLFVIGLNVRVFVSDTGSHFLERVKQRSVSTETPYFLVDNRKIYYIFDSPDLIKLVRNNLMTYNFQFHNFVAKWDHILEFYEKEKTKQLKIAVKLTDSHIKPIHSEKKKVKFAVELLSSTVAAGISTYRDFGAIHQSAEGTIKLITMMNDLFDFLNTASRTGTTKYQNAFCGEEYQISFISDVVKFFDSLKLINPNNGQDCTSKVKFIEGFQISLKALLLLFDDLKTEGYSHILPSKLNQDCLENFFDRVRRRNGKSTEPTSWQFVSAFRKEFLINILKPSIEGSNSDNLAKILLDGEELYDSTTEQDSDESLVLGI